MINTSNRPQIHNPNIRFEDACFDFSLKEPATTVKNGTAPKVVKISPEQHIDNLRDLTANPKLSFIMPAINQIELLYLKIQSQEKAPSKDAQLLIQHAFDSTTPKLLRLLRNYCKNESANKSFTELAIGKELDRIIGYLKLADNLEADSSSLKNKTSQINKKLIHFRTEVLPATFKSALPIAIGLITYHQISASFAGTNNLLGVCLPLLASGVSAATTALLMAWKNLKLVAEHNQEFKQAIRSTVRTLSIGAGIQGLMLCQQFLEKSGFNFGAEWNKIIFYSVLGGLIDATIGYCVDMSQIISDKLDKYYHNKFQCNPSNKNKAISYVSTEFSRFKLLISDLLSAEKRQDLKNFMQSEGITGDKLKKSILFDLLLGATFGLFIAHMGALKTQSSNLARSVCVRGGSKFLAWSEKVLSRSVRTILTTPNMQQSVFSKGLYNFKELLKELVEAVVE